MTEAIKQKIKELFKTTSDDVSVGFGFKQVNGEYTNEIGIVFNVVKKLPLSEIHENEILPSTVEINGVTYNTDVIETGGMYFTACDNSASNPCFSYGYPPASNNNLTPNSQRMRPLKGGCVTSYEGIGGSGGGTLGFIAKHTATGKLVGVTNAHVLVRPEYDAVSMQYPASIPLPDIYNFRPLYQSNSRNVESDFYGNTLYTEKLRKNPFTNFIDAGVVALRKTDSNCNDLITSESWKQVGLDIGTTPPPFATTAELDNLLNYPNLEVASSGVSTGPKQGACGLRISQIHYNTNSANNYNFEDTFVFTRINPDCKYPSASGDSGSAILAKLNGVWKIIGLLFLGSNNDLTAIGCRIDYVASALGIEAWDGIVTSTSFIDPNSMKVIITNGASNDQSLILNGKVYRQGLPTFDFPGNTNTTTTTTTIPPIPVNFDLTIVNTYPYANPAILSSNFTGGSTYFYQVTSTWYLTEAEARKSENYITDNYYQNTYFYQGTNVPPTNYGFPPGTYWFGVRDYKNCSNIKTKSIVISGTTTTTTTASIYKSFTFNSGIAGSSANVCAFTTYNATAFFTGPGTYPTTGSALYFTQNNSQPFRFTGWIKIGNGHAIQGGGTSSNIVANDVTC